MEVFLGFGLVLGLGWFAASLLVTFFPKDLSEKERVVVSLGLGWAVLSVIGVLGVGRLEGWQWLAGVLVIWMGWQWWKIKDRGLKLALVFFGLFGLKILLIETVLPVFAGGMWVWDWRMHFNITQALMGKAAMLDSFMLQRTLGYNAVAAFFLKIWDSSVWAGQGFGKFQIVNAALSSGFLLSSYLLAERLFNRKVAHWSMVIMFFSPWFVHQAYFTWPKMLAVYFMLLGIYFYLDKKKNLMGLVLGLGFLVHPMVLFLIVVLRAWWALWAVVGWYGYLGVGWGFKALWQASPMISHDVGTSLINPGWEMIKSKISNGLFSVIPYYLFFEKLPWVKRLANIYYNPLWGCLTFSGVAVLTRIILVNVKKLGWPLLIYTMLAVLAHSGTDRHGVFHNALTVLGPIAVIWLVSAAGKWIKWLVVGVILEGFLGVWWQIIEIKWGSAYLHDLNWQLKSGEGIVFLADRLSAGWLWGLVVLEAMMVLGVVKYMPWQKRKKAPGKYLD